MKRIPICHLLSMVLINFLFFSCSTNDADMLDINGGVNDYKISDEAFGEYLFYLNTAGVKKVLENGVYNYYIDTQLASKQTELLNLSKAASAITTLEKAGLATADVKIKNVDGLQYFVNLTGLTLTSNEVEVIDLTKLTKLVSLNLNNNFIGALNLTQNTELETFSYTASSKVTGDQILQTIDLSKNTKLKSVDLSRHINEPFPIPAAIFNNLTTAKGVINNEYEITDEAFGEYLKYLDIDGVIEKEENSSYKYYIDILTARSQTKDLNLSKAATAITALEKAGLRTAATKIKDVNGLQHFISTTSIVLTSNDLESIDLTKLTKLESVTLNNNLIGALDLTKNVALKTLTYTASSKATENQRLKTIDLSQNVNLESINLNNNIINSLDLTKNTKLATLSYTAYNKATDSQKLTTIDLSKNTELTSVDLSSHTGAPFAIPAAIFNNLTTAKGVVPE